MENMRPLDLHGILDHGKPDAVLRSVASTFSQVYPDSSFAAVSNAFALANDLYAGRFPGYCACRTGYHDYRHTIDVFVATMRLIDGGWLLGHGVSASSAVDTLIAALFHDAGYIQESDDDEGTGAKYTKTHVVRSADFVVRHARLLACDEAGASRIARIIMGTDLALSWDNLEFQLPEEKRAGEILAAADLLGQMADRAYLEKLLFLYYEFLEAGIGGYETAFDILRKTSVFYKGIAARLDGPLGSVSRDARAHFRERHGEDRDLYRDAIDRQMAYLEGIMADDSVNFRKRLRRIDLEQVERAEANRLRSLGVAVSPAPGR